MKTKATIIFALICTSFAWSIGFQALNFPQNAYQLALSGAGLGGEVHPLANPAAILVQKQPHLQFSHNNWFGDVSGNQFMVAWNKQRPQLLTLQTWDLNDIELWGEIPDEEPLGEFGVHWLATAYTRGYHFGEWNTGFTFRASYAKLYTETNSAVTVDVGASRIFNDNISLGFVLKNIGYSAGDLDMTLPVTIGGGITYLRPDFETVFMLDMAYTEEHDVIINGGIEKSWNSFKLLGGFLASGDQIRYSAGFAVKYRRWEIAYGAAFHENDILGMPNFIDFSLYF